MGEVLKKSESGDQQRPEFAQDGLPKIVLDALHFLAAVSNSVPCSARKASKAIPADAMANVFIWLQALVNICRLHVVP